MLVLKDNLKLLMFMRNCKTDVISCICL